MGTTALKCLSVVVRILLNNPSTVYRLLQLLSYNLVRFSHVALPKTFTSSVTLLLYLYYREQLITLRSRMFLLVWI